MFPTPSNWELFIRLRKEVRRTVSSGCWLRVGFSVWCFSSWRCECVSGTHGYSKTVCWRLLDVQWLRYHQVSRNLERNLCDATDESWKLLWKNPKMIFACSEQQRCPIQKERLLGWNSYKIVNTQSNFNRDYIKLHSIRSFYHIPFLPFITEDCVANYKDDIDKLRERFAEID